jgi:Na+-driven multidrug efflux pump
MLVVIPAELWLAALFGTGDADAGLGIEILSTGAMLAFTYLAAIVLDLELQYVWLALPVASLVTLPIAYAWVSSGRWRRRAI